MSEYFQKEHFDFLVKLHNQQREKDNQAQNVEYEKLKEAYDLTKQWGELTIKKLYPQGYLDFRNSPTDQRNKFKSYTWAKLYPLKNSPRELAVTVGIEGNIGFVTKIDSVNANKKLRSQYEHLRGEFNDGSPVISILPIEDGLSKSIEELAEWSEESIKNFGFSYDDLCTELELGVYETNSNLTTQQVLDYLKERFPEAKQKTKYIFLCLNKSNKEIALETKNLNTTTVRLFISERPPKDIVNESEIRFIDKVTQPNANLNSNTDTLKTGNEFFQICPRSIRQLEAICNWYEMDSNQLFNDTNKKEDNNMKNINNEKSLNRILFGAAGTGKTYHTINHALSIIENISIEVLEKEDRIVLKKRFDDYKDQGQIKFVTFHQSFSYEDFVEGIRAESVQDNEGVTNIEYPIISGVFKSLCDTAITKTIIENQDSQFDENRNNIWKMSLGRAGAEEEIYQYCLQNDCVLIGWGDDLDFSKARNKKQIEEFMDKNDYREYREKYPSASRFVNDFKNKMQNGDLIIVSEGNHKFRAIAEIIGDYSLLSEGKEIPDYVQKRAVKWLKTFKPALAVDQLFDKVLSQQTIYNLANAINFQKLKNILYTSATEAAENKKFVLIIDEINRGNISRIFGELITLIEDSKRVGADEALSVTLPYSKEEFSVPDNVYIIGTMNSSDRSLTGLDIALRRRFTFIEMPPKPELLDDVVIEGLNIGMLLKVINQRIEVLLDRDHCIGHANFMTLTSNSEVKELAQIFKQKIIPQLQEYFFDDWAKINMVLNANGMLKSKAIESSRLFPNVDTDSEGFFEEQKIWQLVETAFDSVDSFNKIIKH
ncbi:AAA family ATPase [Acinetobacter gerneri]|uniref:AAA family ATPase n=1 Tax=Acinetobacter gerneri TaxID=202952 RepID=UPI003A892906